MTLNCIHIFIVTGSFLYWCVKRLASQRFFIYSCIYLRILIICLLATFLGTNSLSVLMCCKAVNQSIHKLDISTSSQLFTALHFVHKWIIYKPLKIYELNMIVRFSAWSLKKKYDCRRSNHRHWHNWMVMMNNNSENDQKDEKQLGFMSMWILVVVRVVGAMVLVTTIALTTPTTINIQKPLYPYPQCP